MFEARAVDPALRAGAERPSGTALSVDVRPSALSSRALHEVLPFDLSGLQVEVTEKGVAELAGFQCCPPRCRVPATPHWLDHWMIRVRWGGRGGCAQGSRLIVSGLEHVLVR